ncbi:beta-ketoacyl synthase N-terminal-like domain-containing protein [Paenibacillus rhizoplanae]
MFADREDQTDKSEVLKDSEDRKRKSKPLEKHWSPSREEGDVMSEETAETGLEIAIIGMSGKFPGADTIEAYWNLLIHGVSAVTQFSFEELREQGISPERLNHPDYVRAKPYLDNVYDFDASLFGYASWEAENMDPQIRLFHEIVYHALENSGYHPDRYEGQIGMYAGGSARPEMDG